MIRGALAFGLPALAAAGCALPLLEPGRTIAEQLTPADLAFQDGSYYREFAFRGTRGDTITALLWSDDFDAMLVLAEWRGRVLAEDDDGGGNCNARLTYVVPRNRFYSLYATSSSGSELGSFRLELRRGAPPAPPADTTCRGFGEVRGTVLLGQTVRGGLDPGDPFLRDSTYFERWTLPVTPGRPFTVDLQSADFDPYLVLIRSRGEEFAADDDGGPGCGARLWYMAEDARPLRVIVSSSNVPPWQTGMYSLQVTAGSLARDSAMDCRFGLAAPGRARRASVIEIGQRAAGALTTDDALLAQDSTYAQWWTVRGSAGHTVTIDLVSEAFDAYLMVTGPRLEAPLEDDDSGGGCHARITLSFPASGDYEIIVNATEPHATGPFTLSVLTSAPPPAPGRCERGG